MLDGREVRFYFPNDKACLPVKLRSGGVELLPWGRRQRQDGRLPVGGWAELQSIYDGAWDCWFPRPVKLMVSQFMEQDIHGSSHWYDITSGKWIQGLVARYDDERRVYVVTVSATQADALHARWPRILSG